MSIQQAAQAAVQTFPNTSITMPGGVIVPLRVLMVAIAGQESSWNATAKGDYGLGGPTCSDGFTSWGLWQIHNVHSAYLTQQAGSSNPCTWEQWLFNPLHNAKVAWSLWQSSVQAGLPGWWPWQSDITGIPGVLAPNAYQKYLAAARGAVQQATPVPSPQSSTPKSTPVRTPLSPPASTSSPLVYLPVFLLALGAVAIALDEVLLHEPRSVRTSAHFRL